MASAALGLKSIIRAISSRAIRRQLVERFAPHADIDWEIPKGKLADAIFVACGKLRQTFKSEHDNLICALQEICDICADPKTPERLVREIKRLGLLQRFKKDCREESRPLQNAVAWTLLNSSEIWDHLLVSAKAIQINAKTVEEYTTIPIRAPNTSRIELLRNDIASYLLKETLHGEYVHIEADEGDREYRYLVSVNSFPINVQQFDGQGAYAVARDTNALNFMFEYQPGTGTLRIKCPLDAQKRRDLVRIFASVLLDAEVKGVARQKYDLSGHLESRILPTPNDSHIEHVRRSGITTSFRNRGGTEDTISLTSDGPTDLNKRMLDFLEIAKVPREKVMVVAVDYDITLHGMNGRSKTIHTRITQDGFQFKCRDIRERRIIMNYLTGIVDGHST